MRTQAHLSLLVERVDPKLMRFRSHYLCFLRAIAWALLAPGLFSSGIAQTPSELTAMSRDLDASVRSGDLVKAAGLADKLDDGVRRQLRTSLTVDASKRVDDVLNWLPGDTESLVVLQYPVVIPGSDHLMELAGKPAQFWVVERLAALNGGEICRRLRGVTIRLAAAGMKNMRTGERNIVPAPMPEGDASYFYFLSEPVKAEALGTPAESADGRPLWRAMAKIHDGQSQHDDVTWLALARPDLLLLSSRRATLIEILGRVGKSSSNRALPASLPEWAAVDQRAQFWGMRHYSNTVGRRDVSNPKSGTLQEPPSDVLAIGMTMRFNTESGELEIHYLTAAGEGPSRFTGRNTGQFVVEAAGQGDWALNSSTRERGNFPFEFGVYMLGFGVYR